MGSTSAIQQDDRGHIGHGHDTLLLSSGVILLVTALYVGYHAIGEVHDAPLHGAILIGFMALLFLGVGMLWTWGGITEVFKR